MYVISAALAIPVSLAALNLAAGEFESARVQTVARHYAGTTALLVAQQIARKKIRCANQPSNCNIRTALTGALLRYACVGSLDYPQSAPVLNFNTWPVIAGQVPTSIIVSQTISCPALLFGIATATATVTVPVP
jgi:hypothetical protein